MGNLTHTVSGGIASFRSAARVPIESLKCHFKPKQDLHGYDYPWPAGGGKNLLNVSINNKVGSDSFLEYVEENGTGLTIGLEGSVVGGYWVKVSPNTTYTYSYTSTYNGACMHARVYELAEKYDGSWSSFENQRTMTINKTSWPGSQSFTTSENTNWLIVGMYAYSDGLGATITNMQIEIGSTATSYAPYENVCSIEGWNSCEVYQDAIYLSKEYKRVEYIESDGNAYIETNYNPVRYDEISIKHTTGYAGHYQSLFSAGTGTYQLIALTYGIKEESYYCKYFASGGAKNLSCAELTDNKTWHTMTVSSNGTFKSSAKPNVTVTSPYEQDIDSSNKHLFIFKRAENSSPFIGKLANFVIKNNGILKLNLIPCIRKIDNIPGVYDTVSNTFYSSASNTEFIAGQELTQTVPVTFPTFNKNKWNDNEYGRSRNNMTQNNYTYSNNQVDTREQPQFYLVAYDENVPIQTIGTLYVTSLGRNSMTVTIPECTHLYFKHNGNTRDLGIKMPFTSEIGEYTLSFNLESNDPTTIGGLIISDIQLESGNTATTYEPYHINDTNIMYGGYIDVAKGELVATYCKHTFNGTEANWSLDGSGNSTRRTYIDTARFGPTAKAKGKLYCSYCRTNSTSAWYGWISSTGTQSSCHILFYVPATIDTVAKWKAYLAENPLEICYELNNPIHYPLSKTELTAFLDNNNFWSNTNDITEVTYNIIDRLLHKRMNIPKLTSKVIWNSLAYPQIKSGQVVNSSGNGTFHITCTMTKADYYTLTESDHYMTIIEGHKYYIHGCPVTDGSIWLLTTCGNNGNQNDKGYGTIATFPKSSNTIRIQIRLEPGTYDFYITPVIVDLTQMFGAGNEPTLVEFEQLCKMNGVNINEAQPFDLGTEKIWYINNYDTTKCNIINWNQIVKDGNFTDSSNWSWGNNYTVTFANNQATLHRDEDTGGTASISIVLANRKTSIPGHKYLFYVSIQTINGTLNISPTGTVADGHATYDSFPTKTTRKWLWECNVTKPIIGELRGYTGGGDIVSPIDFIAENYMIFDLTQMYGAGNEPTITEFERQCNLNNISLDANLPYDTGTKQLWIT